MTTTSKAKAPGIRQTMSDLHIWTGLLAGWLLYAMFLTGTVSYFKEELSQWMRPELPQQAQVPDPAEVAARVAATPEGAIQVRSLRLHRQAFHDLAEHHR